MSPRRRELMERLFPSEPAGAPLAASASSSDATPPSGGPVPFTCVPSTFPELLPHSDHINAASYACATSLAKAKEVWEREGHRTHILLAADTVVVRDGVILEKPASHAHAMDMLRSLNGRTHQVVTGCTLLFHASGPMATASALTDVAAASAAATTAVPAEPLVCSFSVETDVTFAELSEEVIRMYVESNEPMDKAGGYGYQSLAATFVSGIRGCYYNVVGFPVHALATQLQPHLERILAGQSPPANHPAAAAKEL